MTTDSTGPRPAAAASDQNDPAQLEAHIEATRADLAATVDALGEKLDVRSRARRRWQHTQQSLTDDQGRPTPQTQAAAAAAVATGCAVAALTLWRRNR